MGLGGHGAHGAASQEAMGAWIKQCKACARGLGGEGGTQEQWVFTDAAPAPAGVGGSSSLLRIIRLIGYQIF